MQWANVARGLAKRFSERARRYDETGEFPAENFAEMREAGLLRLGVPTEHGGEDVGHDPAGFVPNLVVEELASGCSSTAWNLMIHYVNCSVVAHTGGRAVKERVFRDVTKRGAVLGSLGSEVNTTEQTADAAVQPKLTFQCELTPVEGGFRANGTKHFCTNAPSADYVLLWSLAPGTSDNAEGLMTAVLPRQSEGLSFDRKGWDECIGLRATVSWSAHLKDVFVPWEAVLGEPGDFVQNNPYTFDLPHIAHLLGTTQGAFDAIVKMFKDRAYLTKDQVYMYSLAEISGGLQAARASYWYAQSLWHEGRFDDCLLATYNALHAAREIGLSCLAKGFDICGTRALFKFLPLERASRDIRTAVLHTRDSQLMRMQAQAVLDGGKMFSKQKYGNKLQQRRSWAELGIVPSRKVAS
ncbi:MAG: acyl-CoA dehydrogenase family protein [Hyphomicrobiales bacterium]